MVAGGETGVVLVEFFFFAPFLNKSCIFALGNFAKITE